MTAVVSGAVVLAQQSASRSANSRASPAEPGPGGLPHPRPIGRLPWRRSSTGSLTPWNDCRAGQPVNSEPCIPPHGANVARPVMSRQSRPWRHRRQCVTDRAVFDR